MQLSKYDLYDIHSLLTGIRRHPDDPCNGEMLRAVCAILSAPTDANVPSNIIRAVLRKTEGTDPERYPWVYTDNVYTYGWKIIKDDFCYAFLAKGFLKMTACAAAGDFQRLEDLADTLHNIPIFFADGCRNFKRAAKVQFAVYNQKYKANLYKELAG